MVCRMTSISHLPATVGMGGTSACFPLCVYFYYCFSSIPFLLCWDNGLTKCLHVSSGNLPGTKTMVLYGVWVVKNCHSLFSYCGNQHLLVPILVVICCPREYNCSLIRTFLMFFIFCFPRFFLTVFRIVNAWCVGYAVDLMPPSSTVNHWSMASTSLYSLHHTFLHCYCRESSLHLLFLLNVDVVCDNCIHLQYQDHVCNHHKDVQDLLK